MKSISLKSLVKLNTEILLFSTQHLSDCLVPTQAITSAKYYMKNWRIWQLSESRIRADYWISRIFSPNVNRGLICSARVICLISTSDKWHMSPRWGLEGGPYRPAINMSPLWV